MATYSVYFANAGVPATGLTLTWESINQEDGDGAFTPQPTFTEVGSGWYRFSSTPTKNVVGVIDGSATLGDSDRYVPCRLTPNDENLDVAVSTRSDFDETANDVNLSPTAESDLVDAVWDEILTAATHNISTSAGRRLREVAGNTIYSETMQAGSTINTAVLDAGASSTDGAYDPAIITTVGGTGAGQSRLVMEYNGPTRTCYIDRDWKVIPDNTTQFVLYAHPGREHVNEGKSQGSGSGLNTILLNPLASSNDDEYCGQIIFVRSGSGADQAAIVIDYNGTTKEATIHRDWNTAVDATSVYSMLPGGLSSLAAIDGVGISSTTDYTDIIWNVIATELASIPDENTTTVKNVISTLGMILFSPGTFNKSTGVRSIQNRNGSQIGSTTLSDDGTTVTKNETT